MDSNAQDPREAPSFQDDRDAERLRELQSTAAPKPPALGTRDNALISGPGRRPTRDVFIPTWGAIYRVQGMTGQERDFYEESITIRSKNGNERINVRDARARLIQLTVIDERGQLLFTPDDVKLISRQPAAALEPLFDAARELSGMTQKDFDELTEGFADDPKGGSNSA